MPPERPIRQAAMQGRRWRCDWLSRACSVLVAARRPTSRRYQVPSTYQAYSKFSCACRRTATVDAVCASTVHRSSIYRHLVWLFARAPTAPKAPGPEPTWPEPLHCRRDPRITPTRCVEYTARCLAGPPRHRHSLWCSVHRTHAQLQLHV